MKTKAKNGEKFKLKFFLFNDTEGNKNKLQNAMKLKGGFVLEGSCQF
jgi:hypothetical protein